MQVKMYWQVRVEASETVDALDEFSSEVKRGLVNSELVPAAAWVEESHFDYSRRASVTVRWDTVSDMDADLHEPTPKE